MNVFEVMGDPIRRRIVEVLASGEHSSGEVCAVIVTEFGVTRAGAEWHLGVLRENDWVEVIGESTTRWYRLVEDAWTWLDREVWWLKQLWMRRYGDLSPNDPLGAGAGPIDRSHYGRPRRTEDTAYTSEHRGGNIAEYGLPP
jgi:DNA-binding transcriptional ArsR family regulator